MSVLGPPDQKRCVLLALWLHDKWCPGGCANEWKAEDCHRAARRWRGWGKTISTVAAL